MTAQEYWKKHENQEDVTSISFFEETCKFFSQEISDEDQEEYDFMDMIFHLTDEYKAKNKYEFTIELLRVLRENNSRFYEEEFLYLDDMLIDYYSYLRDEEKVREAFSSFMNRPFKDINEYMDIFHNLIIGQFFAVTDEAFSRNYETICSSNLLEEGNLYEYQLGKHAYHGIFQKYYQQDATTFPKDEILSELDKIYFNFKREEMVISLEKGYFSHTYDLELVKQTWKKEKSSEFNILFTGYFCRYMFDKGMDFRLSGFIVTQILKFWEKKKETTSLKNYININGFYKFLNEELESFSFLSKGSFVNAILWGSVYVYEFLEHIGLISQKDLTKCLSEINILKGKVIGSFYDELWKSNFIYDWPKPNSIEEDTFLQEKELFERSFIENWFELDDEQFKEIVEEAYPLIVKLGEFSKKSKSSENFEKDLLLQQIEELETKRDMLRDLNDLPSVSSSKVGRNDPCPCGSGKKYKKCCV